MTAAESGRTPRRELLGEASDLRVQIVTVEAGQTVDWHSHSAATDTIVAVVGIVVVELRDPARLHRLPPGERLAVPPGTVHRVSGENGAACRFLNVHSGGAYDFNWTPQAG